MCPVRFEPLEGLYYAYKSGRQPDKADSVADVVARKKIKVDSPDVQRIKKEILEEDGAVRRNDEKTMKFMKIRKPVVWKIAVAAVVVIVAVSVYAVWGARRSERVHVREMVLAANPGLRVILE